MKRTRLIVGIVLGMFLFAAASAQAQTGNCGGPTMDTLAVNPTTIVFQNAAHIIAVNYTVAVIDPVITPNPQAPGAGTTFVSQTAIPLATVTPITVTGETDCYSAPIPLSVQASLQLLKQFRVALNYAIADGTNPGWSTASNPFVKAGIPTPLGIVRVKK